MPLDKFKFRTISTAQNRAFCLVKENGFNSSTAFAKNFLFGLTTLWMCLSINILPQSQNEDRHEVKPNELKTETLKGQKKQTCFK